MSVIYILRTGGLPFQVINAGSTSLRRKLEKTHLLTGTGEVMENGRGTADLGEAPVPDRVGQAVNALWNHDVAEVRDVDSLKQREYSVYRNSHEHCHCEIWAPAEGHRSDQKANQSSRHFGRRSFGFYRHYRCHQERSNNRGCSEGQRAATRVAP